jgi:hypothetical protein
MVWYNTIREGSIERATNHLKVVIEISSGDVFGDVGFSSFFPRSFTVRKRKYAGIFAANPKEKRR